MQKLDKIHETTIITQGQAEEFQGQLGLQSENLSQPERNKVFQQKSLSRLPYTVGNQCSGKQVYGAEEQKC